MQLRSNFEPGTTRWAVRRAQWRAMGIAPEDLDKPKIAVVNSSSELSSCYDHLDALVARVKDGIRAAGGIGFEIRTAAPSDFVTSAGKQARYILPSRDLITNDIEVMVEGAQLDGMVCLASCDKTTPGQLMAAGRLDVPTVVVIGGYQGHGTYRGEPTDIETVFESVGAHASGGLSLADLEGMTEVAVCGSGVCAGMGTANSMHIASEALGMSLPGSAPVRANASRVRSLAEQAGRAVIDLVKNDVRPRDVMTPAAFTNAVRTCLSVSASVNTLRHLQAVAVEAEADVDVYDLYDRLAPDVPLLAGVRPNGFTTTEELEDAGGARGLMVQLREQLDTSVLTVGGRRLAEVLDAAPPVDERVIRPLDDPLAPGPSVVLPRGTLAPGGSIVKLGRQKRDLAFRGTAKVFGSQDDALAALGAGDISAGDVVVLRGLGPVGGPGVAFASWFVAALNGAGLAADVAVVTDGQLSGLNRGIVVGQVMPEAAAGGPIGLVADGDPILIDVDARRVDLLVDDDELEHRRATWSLAPPATERGWLSIYQRTVRSLADGAVLTPED